MNSKRNKTAVLYFTRSADEEARAKTFCTSGNFAQNRAIAQRLINHTSKQICASGLTARIITSETQQGQTFGEKLGNAFQNVFDEGFENVIAVGNDCIQLTSDILNVTADLLQENPLVAGPTTDGGTYLLAINRKAFHKNVFSNLAWETDFLLHDFIKYASNNGYELTQLNTYGDIDNEYALRQFLTQTKSADLYFRLVQLLLSILNSAAYIYRMREVAFVSHHARICLFYRGPPVS